VYALLVGINDYQGRLRELDGCADDIRGFQEILEGRTAEKQRHIRALFDGEATRDAVIAGFADHLAKAGPGDVAIFYFSGHGSEEPVEERFWHLEPTRRNQTIVCADSRTPGVPDLADKEINDLLVTVASGGAHVLVVLDCCNSGGGTRDPGALPADVRARFAPPRERPRAPEEYLGFAAEPPARHVTLSACESTQLALELRIMGRYRGVFSAMLQRAITTLGPGATYRELLGATSAAVRDLASGQYPVGYAADLDDLDQPVFGGAVQLRRPTITLEHYQHAWWIDAGTVHGIRPPRGDDTTVLAVLPPDGDRALGHVRVTAVEQARSRVTAVEQARSRVTVQAGWQPDTGLRYRTVVTDVPLPAATVEFRGDPGGVTLVRARLDDSPHVRESHSDPGTEGDRFIVLARNDQLTVAGPDAWPLSTPVPATPAGAKIIAARLEHLARWHLVKRLDNPLSTIAGQVTLEVLDARRGEQPPPPGHRKPLAAAEDGTFHLRYRETPSGRQCPYIFLYVHNHSDRDLYCTVLDLTDRFRCHSKLLPGQFVPAGRTAVAFDGRAIDVAVPKERLEMGGTVVFDWLKVIAAENRFAADAFELPSLDGAVNRRAASRGRGPRTVLDRLADRAVTRDAGDEPGDAPEWTTALITVRTDAT
jgi:hypothetical protein